MTVYKYVLALTDEQNVSMPQNAVFLSCQMQRGDICLWALVEEKYPTEQRVIRIYGTGNPISNPMWPGTFIATVQDRSFVWHVFDGGVRQ